MSALAAALALTAAPGPAAARPGEDYGLAAGLSLPLDPTESPGGALAASASLTELESGPASVMRLRGELLGMLGPDGAALLPILSGDLGGALGPVDLFLSGGVQIFGGAWRGSYTFFTMLGLVGGAGLGVQLSRGLRLELRAGVIWVPAQTAARVVEPEDAPGDQPRVLFLNALAGVTFSR